MALRPGASGRSRDNFRAVAACGRGSQPCSAAAGYLNIANAAVPIRAGPLDAHQPRFSLSRRKQESDDLWPGTQQGPAPTLLCGPLLPRTRHQPARYPARRAAILLRHAGARGDASGGRGRADGRGAPRGGLCERARGGGPAGGRRGPPGAGGRHSAGLLAPVAAGRAASGRGRKRQRACRPCPEC